MNDELEGADTGLSTGNADVDHALGRLDMLDERPLDDHADVYAEIHRSLGSVLDGGSQSPTASA